MNKYCPPNHRCPRAEKDQQVVQEECGRRHWSNNLQRSSWVLPMDQGFRLVAVLHRRAGGMLRREKNISNTEQEIIHELATHRYPPEVAGFRQYLPYTQLLVKEVLQRNPRL